MSARAGGLSHVSLFSGIGGIDLAMHTAGVPTVLACEADKAARGVLAHRFPETELHPDVRTLTGDTLRRLADPRRTVLSAGFPCQDLSVAGARRGMVEGSGTRSALYWEVDRLLGDFRPAWVILENVPGLLSSRGGRDMGAVLGSLAQRGYGFAYRVLDARHFGVPQRRRRVVIVGRLGDDGRAPAQVLLEPEGLPGDPTAGITPRPIFAATARGGAAASGVLGDYAHTLTAEGYDASEDRTGRGTPVVAFALRGREDGAVPEVHKGGSTVGALRSAGGGSSRDYVVAPTAFHMTQDPISGDVSPAMGAKSGGMGIAYAADEVSTLQAGGGDRGYRVDAEGAAGGHLIATFQKVIRPQTADHPDVWEHRDVAATLSPFDLGSDGRAVELVVDPQVTVRRLTPVECERLQGFPDGHTATSNGKPQADSPRYKQLGNAVAVPVFEWVARRIAAVEADMTKAGAA